jgi:hypothetical protein
MRSSIDAGLSLSKGMVGFQQKSLCLKFSATWALQQAQTAVTFLSLTS